MQLEALVRSRDQEVSSLSHRYVTLRPVCLWMCLPACQPDVSQSLNWMADTMHLAALVLSGFLNIVQLASHDSRGCSGT